MPTLIEFDREQDVRCLGLAIGREAAIFATLIVRVVEKTGESDGPKMIPRRRARRWPDEEQAKAASQVGSDRDGSSHTALHIFARRD